MCLRDNGHHMPVGDPERQSLQVADFHTKKALTHSTAENGDHQ